MKIQATGYGYGVKRRWIALAILGLAAFGQAQPTPTPSQTTPSLPIETAPPAISFSDWREIPPPVTEPDREYREYEATFPSALVSPYPANNVVPLRIYRPNTNAPVPVVLIAHYWGAQDLRAETNQAIELCRRGIGAAIITLPYHLKRTPPGFRSGELAVTADIPALKETTLQSVLDIRRAIDFLQQRPEFVKAPLGLIGISLGGVVGATAFAVEPRITHITFLVAGLDLANIIWNSSRLVKAREGLRARGMTEEKLRAELAGIEAKTRLPRNPPGTAFMVVGKFDTVIPESSSDALVAAFPDSAVLRLDTGHYGGVFVQRRLIKESAEFFQKSFQGTKYVPPAKLYAPTIRLGLTFDSLNGFGLGAGLDIWRLDRSGDTAARLFLTPRSVNLWITREVSQGLSLGAFVGLKGGGIGVMWAVVL